MQHGVSSVNLGVSGAPGPTWIFRSLPVAAWRSLAPFVHRHNQRPDGRERCLHAAQGVTSEDHAQELGELSPASAVFVVADEAPQGGPTSWSGMIGAEIDTALSRAWLRGPLLREPDAACAGTLRRGLIEALLQACPTVQRFDAFPSADETAMLTAYHDCGFADLLRHHVLRVEQPNPMAARGAVSFDLAPVEPGAAALADVLPLHDRLFPDTYLPGRLLAASLDAGHRLFAAREHGAVVGYVLVKEQRLENDGYVDYLGVAESARGRGVGRALLDAAVRWALQERGLPRVHLTVRQDRAPALGLYQAAGFREVAAGQQMCWRRGEGRTAG